MPKCRLIKAVISRAGVLGSNSKEYLTIDLLSRVVVRANKRSRFNDKKTSARKTKRLNLSMAGLCAVNVFPVRSKQSEDVFM